MTVLSRRGPLYGVKGALVHGGKDGEVVGTEVVSTTVDSVVAVVDGGGTYCEVDDGGVCTENDAVAAGLG